MTSSGTPDAGVASRVASGSGEQGSDEPGSDEPGSGVPVSPSMRLEDQLCFSLYTSARLVTRLYGPVLDELGLTYPQYVTLLALWDAPGPMSVGELGSRLHLDSGTLTPLLKRLEARGVVSRQRSNDDERRVLISLTEDGRRLREQACQVPSRVLGDDMTGAQRMITLKGILDDLIAALDPPAASQS